MCNILVLNVSSPCGQYPHKRSPYVVSNCKMTDVHIKSIINAKDQVKSHVDVYLSALDQLQFVFWCFWCFNYFSIHELLLQQQQKRLNKIFQVFSDTLDIPIEPDPILIIFGVSEEFLRLTRVQQQLISAKKTYPFVLEEKRSSNS